MLALSYKFNGVLLMRFILSFQNSTFIFLFTAADSHIVIKLQEKLSVFCRIKDPEKKIKISPKFKFLPRPSRVAI
jgi:hypothetical protein